jgi:hypothetical protein
MTDETSSEIDPALLDPAMDEEVIRNRVADDARAAVGTGSTGAEERQDQYALRLFPDTPNARLRAQMADSMYSCGLSALAAMRASKVTAVELHENYATHIGEALEWLASIAQRMKAYVPLPNRAACEAAVDTLLPGDILVVEGPVHVIVLTARVDDQSVCDFITSEGGKPEVDPKTNEHGMCIHSRRMRLRVNGGRLQTGSVHDDGTVTWGRLALYQIATGKLLYADRA